MAVGRSVYLEANARVQEQAIALGGEISYLDPQAAREFANYVSARLGPLEEESDGPVSSKLKTACAHAPSSCTFREFMAAHDFH